MFVGAHIVLAHGCGRSGRITCLSQPAPHVPHFCLVWGSVSVNLDTAPPVTVFARVLMGKVRDVVFYSQF
jgi:hypothetical protein